MWTLLPPQSVPRCELDDAQREASEPAAGVSCVLGGPGTGKTVTLVESVVRRVQEGAPLSEIAVLAGSRQAAQQLRRTVIGRIGQAQTQPLFTTVHGLALGLLRLAEPSDELPWALLRAPEQEERIRDLLANGRASWPTLLQPALKTRGFARQLREVLARIRQRSLDEHDVAHLAQERESPTLAAIADFLDEYLAVGDLAQTLDYAELVYRTRLVLHDPASSGMAREHIREVFVDDAHDLDPAQTALLGDLAMLGIPVTVFGDPDQVVSEFRGATAQGMLHLTELEPSRVMSLAHDHRHAVAVVEGLNALRGRIAASTARAPLVPVRSEQGEICVELCSSESAEVAHVADGIRRVVASGASWSDIAVIARAGKAQLMPLTRALLRLGIPVEVAADELVLAEDDAVAALLRALCLAASSEAPTDDQARALALSPLVGLDAIALRRLERHIDGDGVWAKMLAADPEGEWAIARSVADTVTSVSSGLEDGCSVADALWELWSCTSWPSVLQKAALDGNRQANHHLDAVVELFERAGHEPVLSGTPGVWKFARDLEGQEIPADTGRESRITGTGVLVTTAHRAKGREWQHVWVVGVQEGRWPQAAPGGQLLDPGRLLDGEPRTIAEHLQEERRLFYLACARACTSLHVSAVASSDLQPSRFLTELGAPLVEVTGYPARPLTAQALVGELRQVLADPERSMVLRRGAAARLQHLAAEGIASANPANWWGASQHPPHAGHSVLRLSGSALEGILTCPRQYYLARRARAKRPSNQAASFGSLIHEVAQHAQTDNLDAAGMRALLDDRWSTVDFAAPWQETNERVQAESMIDRLAAWFPEQSATLLGVEQGFEARVEVEGREVLLHGFVDRLELMHTDEGPKLRILDFKTMRSKPTASSVATNVQLGLYQLAAQSGGFDALAPGVREVASAALVMLRIDASGLPLVMEQSSLTAAPELPDEPLIVGPTWMHDRIASAKAVLERGEFPATPGDACRICDFRSGCPAIQEIA
ncbi:ATP-dependent DNA helicase [uncultured Tessaracoccus sp.]|uniref:ATP-dependent DNA helicase n=1 Tax=uncultured Tessaracoccus sp. TaxID=905023 RepID=UPI0026101689|nr:ATP-dependent DNA helicase [uncultured Tessaracoccus sp.]